LSFEKRLGVVLSGGLSRRFGEPKAFSLFKGKAMYQWALQAIHPLVDETIIVSHPTLVHRFKQETSETIYEDEENYLGLGPLAGIYTGMLKQSATWYYVLPCDTPLITCDVFFLLEKHLKENDVLGIIPMYGGRLQPLISIFHRDLLPTIKNLLDQGLLRMTDLTHRASIKKIELNEYYTDNPFININTKLELLTTEEMQLKGMDK
jgi:molybdenum cofactor guanylyltransferase